MYRKKGIEAIKYNKLADYKKAARPHHPLRLQRFPPVFD